MDQKDQKILDRYLDQLRKQMGFTNECWEEFMSLCQKKVEPLVAYSLVRVYREHATEKWIK